LTKLELIDVLSKKSNINQKDVHFIIDSFLDIIKICIDNEQKVKLRNFGTFYKKVRKSKKVYSPIIGKIIEYPSKNEIAFKASKTTEKIMGA